MKGTTGKENKIMAVPNDVTDLIKNSGNNFHAQVASWFSYNSWHVIVSPYYLDQTQNKAREIDLIVEKLWPIKDDFGHQRGELAVRLFVECKYVPSYSAFWFADKDRNSALECVCAGGFFQKGNFYTEKHHYLANCQKVAKVFASSRSKALENEPFYKALNQTLNAMVSMTGRPVSIPAEERNRREPIKIIMALNYSQPVLSMI